MMKKGTADQQFLFCESSLPPPRASVPRPSSLVLRPSYFVPLIRSFHHTTSIDLPLGSTRIALMSYGTTTGNNRVDFFRNVYFAYSRPGNTHFSSFKSAAESI